ncbi:MAG: DUF924 family protein [Pseudomonadota bacterium]
MPITNDDTAEILKFWFGELTPKQWFKKSDDTDALCRERFGPLLDRLAREVKPGETEDGFQALAAVILFDQLPRNIHRDTPKAFETDPLALAIAKDTVIRDLDTQVSRDQRLFLYMPFEHSENLDDQDRGVALIASLGNDEYTPYAEAHRDVIARFGRFPHRNAILGRASTEEELAYLAEPGSGF